MAIDSEYKRRSAAGAFLLGSLAIFPTADGTIGANDRYQVNGVFYHALTGIATTDLNIISDTAVEPVHISDSGANLLIKGDLEVQGDTYLQAVNMYDEATLGASANITKATNDMTLTTATEKTLVLSQPVYEDIIINASTLRVGGSAPTFAAFQDSIYGVKFINGQTDIIYGSFEIPHSYKEGTDLEVHLHWSPDSTNTGDCVFNMAYSIAGMGGTFGDEVPLSFTQAGSGTINKHQYVSANNHITGSITIGSIVVFALSRPTGDDFTGDAFLHSIGVHYQQDTLGSRTIITK